MKRIVMAIGLACAIAQPVRAQAPRFTVSYTINRSNPWDFYVEGLGGSIPTIACPSMFLELKYVGLGGEFPVYSPGLTDVNGRAVILPAVHLAALPLFWPPVLMRDRCDYYINPVIAFAGATLHVVFRPVCPGGVNNGQAIGGYDFYTNQSSWSASSVGAYAAKSSWYWFAQACGMNVDNWNPWIQFLQHSGHTASGFVLKQCTYWEGAPTTCP